MQREYKFFAFISYSGKDLKWGKRLQRRLESYRLPTTICSEKGLDRKPIRPVFFAPSDIKPGPLDDEIKARLEDSRNLIVIGSPNSAHSEWVGREIAVFHGLGRDENIHYFIVDGIPNSKDDSTECFHPIISDLGIPEILGANIHEKIYRSDLLNRERAFAQIVSKLLNVEFDEIWQRQKRRLVNKIISRTMCAIAVLLMLFAMWKWNQPVDVRIAINEASAHNDSLPPLKNAVVTMGFDNETKTDTITDVGAMALFSNVPHRFIGKRVKVRISCVDFLPTDTIVTLSESMVVNISRDSSVYGDVLFCLCDNNARGLVGATIGINGQTVLSDAKGMVRLRIPLKNQRTAYRISADFPLECDTLFMPCSEYQIIRRK